MELSAIPQPKSVPIPVGAEPLKTSSLKIWGKEFPRISQVVPSLDKVGSCVSAACAIHCVLMPVVITFLPLLGIGFLAEETFEELMIGLALALATLSLCLGMRIHGRRQLVLLVPAAALLFAYSHLFEGDAHWILMGLGGAALAIGHLINRRLCASCPSCHGH